MNEKIGKIKLELLKEEFIKQIKDSYTLNLSMVLLEEFENLQQENKQLKEQAQDLKADYGTIAQIERDLYKEVIDRAIKHVSSLSSKGRGCMIYADVKKDILNILKGSDE